MGTEFFISSAERMSYRISLGVLIVLSFSLGKLRKRHWLFKQSMLTEGDKLEIHSESLFEWAFNLSCGQVRYLNKIINHLISNYLLAALSTGCIAVNKRKRAPSSFLQSNQFLFHFHCSISVMAGSWPPAIVAAPRTVHHASKKVQYVAR